MTAATGKQADKAALAPERSKDRILAAAAELARERGVAGATIARVCQRSGLPVSSVYWHFDDKDHLFAEVIRTSFARWLVSVPSWDSAQDTTLEEGLKRVLIPSTRTLAEVPAFLRVGMQVLLESGEQNAKTREAFVDTRNQVRLMIAAWLSSYLPAGTGAGLAEDLATLVVAFTDGMLVGSQVYAHWEPEEFVELIAATVAAAAGVEAAR